MNRATRVAPLLEIALVVFLGAIKFGRGYNLGDDGAPESFGFFELRLGRFGGGFLLRRVVKNHRAVLRADVGPLAVRRGGVVARPEKLVQLFVARFLGIELDMHGLGVTGAAGANVFVSRTFKRPAHVTDGGFAHAGEPAESSLDAPKTASAERGLDKVLSGGGGLLRIGVDESQRGGVEAVAQPGGRRAILEDMAEMGVAAGADNLGANHAVAAVGDGLDIFRRDGLKEAGPAGAGIKFRAGGKQRQIATDAMINALPVVIV